MSDKHNLHGILHVDHKAKSSLKMNSRQKITGSVESVSFNHALKMGGYSDSVNRVLKIRASEDKSAQIRAVAKGKIRGDVRIELKPEGLDVAFTTDQTEYKSTIGDYTSDKYQFQPNKGRNPEVKEKEGVTYVNFCLSKTTK